MRLIASIVFLSFLTGTLFSQASLKAGDKAPKINITDYLLNTPNDISLENKFVILEFWATWCAPCLASVPHLNQLQDEFKDRKDLIFLSITYEKPEKTRRTLEKIKFETVVVSDQTKETEQNYNVKGIPHTVLIDNKGLVQWIGTPDKLNSALIESFLSGKIIASKSKESESPVLNEAEKKEKEKQEEVNTTELSLKFMKDKNTQFLFILNKSKESDPKMAIEFLAMGKYIDQNNGLKSILSKILKKPEAHIIIPDEMIENTYNLLYKNSNTVETYIHLEIIKNNVLTSLNLGERTNIRSVEVHGLKIVDPDKLIVALKQEEENHNSQNDTHFIFSNARMESLIKVLGDHHGIIMTDETGLEKNLDLILRKGTLNDLQVDLAEYGLMLDSSVQEIEFYIYKQEEY